MWLWYSGVEYWVLSVWCYPSPTQTHCHPQVIHYNFSPPVCFHSLCFDTWGHANYLCMKIQQIQPLCMSTNTWTFLFVNLSCKHLFSDVASLVNQTLERPRRALADSPQSRLSSQREHAVTAELGVLSSHPSPLQRAAQSIGGSAIVCCAGVLPPTGSEGSQKATELHRKRALLRCYRLQIQTTWWGLRQWEACGLLGTEGGL